MSETIVGNETPKDTPVKITCTFASGDVMDLHIKSEDSFLLAHLSEEEGVLPLFYGNPYKLLAMASILHSEVMKIIDKGDTAE